MGIELAIDVMEQSARVDHIVLFSGDGDFATQALQRKGRKVSVVSTISTQPPMAADELRRQADPFIDLITLRNEINRHLSETAPRPTRPARQDANF